MPALLWYDSTPGKELEQIVREAAARFAEKFGVTPDHASVNRNALSEPITVDGITVEGADNILNHHVWISRDAE